MMIDPSLEPDGVSSSTDPQKETTSASLDPNTNNNLCTTTTPTSTRSSYKQHVSAVSYVTMPIIATEIFQNTLPIVDIAFVGRALSKEDLAAAALATVWFNLWNSCMIGFLTASDTLLSQSFGARELSAFATWTGSSLVWAQITTLFVVAPMIALCGPAMTLFGQETTIADEAARFSYRLLPGLFPYYAFKVLVRYLQTQDILWPGVAIGILANLFNILFNWLLIYYWNMELAGAPWATTLTRAVECVSVIAYLYWSRRSKLATTWPVICREHFWSRQQMRPFRKLAIMGALSIAAEAWSFEISVILAGLLGTVPLDAHVITLSVATFVFLSFPFAIGVAASIRIGQLIGEGLSRDAERSCYVSVGLSLLVQGLWVAILLPCSNLIGDLFSSDEEVANLTAELFPISCIFMLGDALQAVVGGVLRGLGRQNLVLLLNIIGFWLLAVPLGSVLTFATENVGVQGLWWGFVVGIYSSAAIGVLILWLRIDWNGEAQNAAKRLSALSPLAQNVTGENRATSDGESDNLAK